ncbi:ribonuclease III [Marinimicrobium sp. ABcell2]|uniref:ribonuclease III n=1 Tax=Marinimicrobium sp. ABcell2 TaxID=3069751 RepID=UPI0027B4B690|nr:ribonuclease III [Marinimicrobium sp. ABcell2]MDQ2075387.1 ribonuclease III [Marinimicrobium sp. ABcell2]
MSQRFQRLQDCLGYRFRDDAQLELALTHRSFGSPNNERLEFLGDSILNFIIGEALYRKLPEAREGQLSRLRAQMVKGETLAELAHEFELGGCLRLGEGEMKSGGQKRDSILADAVEAIIGAIYLEAGFDACAERVNAWYQPRLAQVSLDKPSKDPKTELQEFLQAKQLPLPDYQVVEVAGQAHAHTFTIACRVALLKQAVQASASSRREAEKQAAAAVLEKLRGH